MTRGARGFGFLSEHFQRAGFMNGPWVPSPSPFCRQWLHCAIFHLLTPTTDCPTEGFLKLWASFDSLHLPQLGLCTNPHSLPVLGLSMQELQVGWCRVSRSQLYSAFSSAAVQSQADAWKRDCEWRFCLVYPAWKQRKGKGTDSTDTDLALSRGLNCLGEGHNPGWRRASSFGRAGATEQGEQLAAAHLLKVTQYSSSAFDL